MAPPIQFSTDDLKTPDSLERVLRQFQVALSQIAAPSPAAAAPSLTALAAQLAPLLNKQLSAGGIAPLNLQSLLPSIADGAGISIEDTHASRLTLYPASNYPAGTLYYETDRTTLYAVISSSGALVWQYVAGMFAAPIASKPADLGTNDTGFLYWVTVQNHIFRWAATTWSFVDEEGGSIIDRVSAPTSTGWQLCDGTATDYLQISAGNIVATAFTTPDETTANPGTFHTSAAAYTAVFNAATAPVFTGTPAVLTGSVSAPVFTGNAVTSGNDSGTGTVVAAGVGTTVATHTHTHDTTATGSNNAPTLTMNSYTPAGTVAATAKPLSLGVLRYFRR